jgi:hypothetical protein
MTQPEDTPEQIFESIKPLIEAYVTERILMFYEHAVECGGMSRMTAPPVFTEKPPKTKLEIVK